MTKGRTILKATCEPLRAAFRPDRPTAPAIIMLGVMLMLLVINRRNQGRILTLRAPSLTIWPAIVQTIPAVMPDNSRASANKIPAAGEIDDASKSCMLKISASTASGFLYKEAPATIRIAELTKSAKVKRAMASSAMEVLSEDWIASSDGI